MLADRHQKGRQILVLVGIEQRRGKDVYKRQLLKNADPEVKAQLRLALLT